MGRRMAGQAMDDFLMLALLPIMAQQSGMLGKKKPKQKDNIGNINPRFYNQGLSYNPNFMR